MYCPNCIFYTLPSLERVGRAGSVVLTKYCPAACFHLWPNQDINYIVKPGMPVHFDPPCLNIYCGGVIIGLRDLVELYRSHMVSPLCETSPREQIFSNASYFILEPTHGASNPMD